jgi:hypothetical protein
MNMFSPRNSINVFDFLLDLDPNTSQFVLLSSLHCYGRFTRLPSISSLSLRFSFPNPHVPHPALLPFVPNLLPTPPQHYLHSSIARRIKHPKEINSQSHKSRLAQRYTRVRCANGAAGLIHTSNSSTCALHAVTSLPAGPIRLDRRTGSLGYRLLLVEAECVSISRIRSTD